MYKRQFLEPVARLYFFPPYRLWQFLAGCCAARLYKKHERFFRWSPAVFSFGVLYLLYQTFIGALWGSGGKVASLAFLLPDTLIAVLTIASACSLAKSPQPPAVKIPAVLIHLTNRASLLTYAVFLLHVPLLQFMQYIWPQDRYGTRPILFWICAALLLIAVGAAMHYGIEQPCGKWLSSRLKRAFARVRNIKFTAL